MELALSEESKESNSVSSLKHTLTELQKEVNVAHEKLHVTQARVQQSLQRMEELKAETVSWCGLCLHTGSWASGKVKDQISCVS